MSLSSELANEEQLAFYRSFSAELLLVLEWLQAQPQPFAPGIVGRLSKLLANLEKLSKWPPSVQPDPARPRSKCPVAETRPKTTYPNLFQLLSNPTKIKKSLRYFVKHESQYRRHHQSLLDNLRKFPKWKESAAFETTTAAVIQTQLGQDYMVDYTTYAKTLYKVLSEHSICRIHGAHRRILPHLRLSACRDLPATCAPFSIFFLDHPHDAESQMACQWQNTQVQVFKSISFTDDLSRPSAAGPTRVIELGNFCGIISNRQNVQLSLSVVNNKLILKEPCHQESSFLLDMPSVPLSQLIEGRQLSRKMRLLLCYLLAKAVWQFYDSEWMDLEWTRDNVHFMFERRSETPKGIFVNEPFLAARFAQKPDDSQARYRLHKFPKILALGIMLLEVELGLNIAKKRTPDCFSVDGQPTVNADLTAAMSLFRNEELWERQETFTKLKDAVGRCLKPSLFEPFRNDIGGQRDILHKQIVLQLHALFRNAWEDPEETRLSPVYIEISSPQRTPGPDITNPCHLAPATLPPQTRRMTEQQQQPQVTQTQLAVRAMSSNVLFDSETWFAQLDRLNLVLGAPKNGAKYQAVRVAVLDTGIEKTWWDSIEQYKDFVTLNDEIPQDLTGHGTNTAWLINKVFSKAELYIARVLDTNRMETSSSNVHPQDRIAMAIRHAIDEWKVDIITICIGSESDHKGMTDEIMRARQKRILVFAAASNYSNLRSVAFPARMEHDVLCMFSTNAGAKSSASLNPSAVQGKYNFAILGEDVRLYENQEPPLTGTSIATAIGAGLAARLLDFSRHDDCRDFWTQEHAVNADDVEQKLKLLQGMSAVLAYMARLDNGYHCITPWRLLKGLNDDAPRAKKRQYICGTIYRILEHMHEK
ncbi:hypothetical protein QBC46DRAFT_111160 [Diplogelasinospora grovesii]|uniref:Peptidase S8/S53 domain-containing protein n=1 Tax=Diplogelasinospora grovesii TaxID=303347 RepID=A0AAN6S5B0_9PEZI|nr:hypothetical protein QBC46DRAFT_111160 [Diplogelasinospora grovesii]